MDYTGPSGDEARALLREIRSLALLQSTHGATRGSRGSPFVARSSAAGSSLSPRQRSPVSGTAAGAAHRRERLAAARAESSGLSDRSQADLAMDQDLSNDI